MPCIENKNISHQELHYEFLKQGKGKAPIVEKEKEKWISCNGCLSHTGSLTIVVLGHQSSEGEKYF